MTLAQRLAAYGTLLPEANRRTNLTGAKTPDALAPHILDSLTLVPFVVDPLSMSALAAAFRRSP